MWLEYLRTLFTSTMHVLQLQTYTVHPSHQFYATTIVLYYCFLQAFNTVLGQQGVANNYTVSVRLLQYRNPESRIGSILRTPCCNIFTCDDCNNRFVFCLRPPNSAEDDLSCPLGRLESNSIRNDNIEFDNSFPSEQGGESEEKPNLFTFRGVSNRVSQVYKY